MDTFIFVLSWERPIYTWVCLDSIYRLTGSDKKVVLADNNSQDPLVRQVIKGFERRGLFHAVHLYDENLPDRLNSLIDEYWDEIDEYFILIESDIEIMTPEWLRKMKVVMDENQKLALLGSLVVKSDFVGMKEARNLLPDLRNQDLVNLIKAKAPERKRQVDTNSLVANPYPPPLRLTMYRKEHFKKINFGRDVYNSRQFESLDLEVGISTKVRHRHLSLLNIFDYHNYDNQIRNNFFALQKKYPYMDLPNLSKVVFVLGMPGEDFKKLTLSLKLAGIDIIVVQSIWDNDQILRNIDFISRIQEDILKDNDSSWYMPRTCYDWKRNRYEELEKILLTEINEKSFWAFADPVSTFTLYGWFNLIPRENFVFIAQFCHPGKFRERIYHPSGIHKESSDSLWYKYNRQLLSLSEDIDICWINSDSNPTEYTRRILEFMKDQLDTKLSDESSLRTYVEESNPSRVSSESVKTEQLILYEKIVRLSKNSR